MKRAIVLIVSVLGCLGCQKNEREEESRPADFEKMVIIQDQDTSETIGGESERELKLR